MKSTFLPALIFTTIAAHAAPVPIFDGKTLDGWDYDQKIWRVEDGMITGGSTTEKIKANYFICTRRSYQNFELRLKIKCSGDPATGMINSGIQVRSVRVPGGAHMSGYQVDCGKGWFGKIYDEFRRNRVIAEPLDAAALDKAVDVFGWNEYRIRAEGPRIQTWINGVLAIDYTEQDGNIALDGQIGPQVHSGGVCLVQVKDVTIEELPPTPGAPTWESLGGVEAARKLVAPPPKPKPADAPKKPGGAAPPGKPGAAAAPFQNTPGKKRDTSYNAVQGMPRSAAEQQKLFHLPEGFEIELVVQESEGIGKFVSVYFDQRGRMWTQTALEYPVDGNESPAAAEAVYQRKGRDKVLVYPRESVNAPIPAGGLTNPAVFADGLAIPLGILPWGNGDTCYIQHGHDLKLFKDTNGDGRADTHTVILTGFGVQDSHLFPHQFTRAPGGWIWMAQGLFNNSKVRKPGSDKIVDWPKCSMAKMRPDGSQFEVTSTGPNNIWGLVITGEGEAFIQEANDYGYPVMPFHEYAYYPGGMEALKRSYQPEFPPQAEFRMGGTGLSGLALLEGEAARLLRGKSAQSSVLSAQSGKADASKLSTEHWALSTPAYTMLVANPIISKVQTLAMHRDGPRWKLEQAADLITCDDPFFRPVAMTNGPDGCIYIVDWYNKIISHNEVPRAHPDRDKTRGRIWRVKAKAAKPFDVPDFTKLSGDELIAKLGGESLAQSHLAWQAIEDRGVETEPNDLDLRFHLVVTASNRKLRPARRIPALWGLSTMYQREELLGDAVSLLYEGLADPNRNFRRESVRMIGERIAAIARRAVTGHEIVAGVHQPSDLIGMLLNAPHEETPEVHTQAVNDADPEVRAEVIRSLGYFLDTLKPGSFPVNPADANKALSVLLILAREPLAEPVAPSTRNGKPIKVREAYDREFERYLVRMFLERHPDAVEKFLDSDAAKPLPVESRLLASLALEPKTSAARVAKLLPQLQRPPGQEEILRLAQFPDEAGVGDAVRGALANAANAPAVLDALIELRSKLDPAKLAPLVAESATKLLASKEAAQIETGVKLAGAFKLAGAESTLVAIVRGTDLQSVRPAAVPDAGERRETAAPAPAPGTVAGRTDFKSVLPAALRALADIGSTDTALFSELAERSRDPLVRDEALAVLAASRAADAPARVLALYPKLAQPQRRVALDKLTTTKAGASAVLAAVSASGVGAAPAGTTAAGGANAILKADLDAATLDRLLAILGDKDAALNSLVESLGALFRTVLALDGTDGAFAETGLTLEGPLTVETWVKLDAGIGNADGILGAAGQLDLNFHGGQFRVWAGPALHDVAVAKRKIVPDMWTHVAATRDAAGIWKLYLDGELDAIGTKPAGHRIENAKIGWTGARGGTKGQLAEFRIWKGERTAEEIRANFDRSVAADGRRQALLLNSADAQASPPPSVGGYGKLAPGAKLVKASDLPPVLGAEAAAQIDAKFSKYRALAARSGDIERGKAAAIVCQACHLFGTTGGQIGPNLSGVGAMGAEAILRNILTPNAAMEAGYRIYRVEQRDGSVLDAFFVSEDKDEVVIRLPGAADQRIAKRDIVRTSFLRRSLMAEGLLDGMSDQQASDLFAYLLSLK